MPQIFVGNLPFDACESDLRGRFERYGRVNSVRIVTDAATSRPRGFAFVNMPSMDDAEEAVARLAGSELGGRRLTINEASSSPSTSSPSSVRRQPDASGNRIMAIFKALQDED